MSKMLLICLGFINTFNLVLGINSLYYSISFIRYDIRDKDYAGVKDELISPCFIHGILSVVIMALYLAYIFGFIGLGLFMYISIICYVIGGFFGGIYPTNVVMLLGVAFLIHNIIESLLKIR